MVVLNMWKDFFYYTKTERRAIYTLLVLIALFVFSIVWLSEPSIPPVTDFSPADSMKIPRKTDTLEKDLMPVNLVAFDPNLADSIEFSTLGLPPYVIRNIIKYRKKGGRFSTPESFSRIYGLTDEKFKELEPYIHISKPFVKNRRKIVDTVPQTVRIERKSVPTSLKYPEGTLVDLNLADTVELKKIPGIGSVIAQSIVAYRNRLGGFYSLEQLEEINYVTPALMRWFKLEEVTLRQLKINDLGLEQLRAHPYLNFYQAKVILEHRRKKGAIKSLSQLSLYEEFTEKDLKRLSVYVSFD